MQRPLSEDQRRRALEALHTARSAGRLVTTQYEARRDALLRATTVTDLAPLFDDLPRRFRPAVLRKPTGLTALPFVGFLLSVGAFLAVGATNPFAMFTWGPFLMLCAFLSFAVIFWLGVRSGGGHSGGGGHHGGGGGWFDGDGGGGFGGGGGGGGGSGDG